MSDFQCTVLAADAPLVSASKSRCQRGDLIGAFEGLCTGEHALGLRVQSFDGIGISQDGEPCLGARQVSGRRVGGSNQRSGTDP